MPSSSRPLLALLFLTAWFFLISLFTRHIHLELPAPTSSDADKEGRPIFNEARARDVIGTLSSGNYSYRIVGTAALQKSEHYLLQALSDLKAQHESSPLSHLHHLEFWHQVDDGSHLFNIAGKKIWKRYYGMSNVIARLSSHDPASQENSVLINAHLDSTLPSPGAADDLSGCSVMLGVLRAILASPDKLENSITFLWNAGEESLQDASHLYITKHFTKDSVRAVVNLEAAGTTGKTIVFQATSEAMVKAYQHVPWPFGTVLATEIFGTGIIVSDTDFVQFETYGNLTGLDMAIVQNSYVYHTQKDTLDRIQHGSLQHMGDNTLALLRYLATTPGALSNIVPSRSTVFFSMFGTRLLLVYSASTALSAYGTMLAIITAIIIQAAKRDGWAPYIKGTAVQVLCLISSLGVANLNAFLVAQVFNKSLSWYRHELYPVFLFSPPAFLGVAGSVYLFKVQSIAITERASLLSMTFNYCVLAFAGQLAGIGSSYMFAIGGLWLLLTVLLSGVFSGTKSVPIWAYFFGGVLPWTAAQEGLMSFLDLFVPLGGRMGDAPADHIIGSLVAFLAFVGSPMWSSYCFRLSEHQLRKTLCILLVVSGLSLSFFSRPGWQAFDSDHPKRIFSLYKQDISTNPSTTTLHIASVDRAPGFHELVSDMLEHLQVETGQLQAVQMDDYNPDWDVRRKLMRIAAISQFLTNYKVTLPNERSYHSPWADSFKVFVTNSRLNAVTRRRSLTIEVEHPGLIWTNLAFDADVVDWDLSALPDRGVIRHHIKEASGYGVDKWSISMTIQLTEVEFDAALKHSQVLKGQRKADPAGYEQGLLKVDFSGIDRDGLFSANRHSYENGSSVGMDMLAKLDAHLPTWIDGMLLVVCSGRVSI